MENNSINSVVPSVGGAFSFSWRKMFEKNFLTLLVVVIIVGILTGPEGASFKFDGNHGWGNFNFVFGAWFIILILIGLAWSFLVAPIFKFGEKLIFLQAMRDESLDLKTLFVGFKTKYVNIVLTNLILFALIGIGIVMLVVPGIIIACRLVYAPLLVMDEDLEPMAAIEESWKMTRGHGWTIFFMAIISFFIAIGGLLVCIVGIFISLIWIHAAFATLYQAIKNQDVINNTIPIIDTIIEED